jgi:hypothetical protein
MRERLNSVNAGSLINTLNNPVFVDWLSTLAISVGTALIVAGVLSLFSARLLGLAPHYKLWSFIVGFAFLCSLSAVVRAEPDTWSAGFFVGLLPILVVLIYFLPTAAAISVGNPYFQSVFLMNLFFGWTVVGWLAALAWGLRRPPVEAPDYKITPFGAVAAGPPDNPRPQA